jgi:hypothetical protein
MMAREGLIVESQTLWDQLNAMARHLEPTYVALGRRALDAPVINVDEPAGRSWDPLQEFGVRIALCASARRCSGSFSVTSSP